MPVGTQAFHAQSGFPFSYKIKETTQFEAQTEGDEMGTGAVLLPNRGEWSFFFDPRPLPWRE
jgi:hypothetical protein